MIAVSTFPLISYSQLIVYQDIFNGGITGGGFSTMLGAGSGQIELHIAENSTIRKAYLVCHRYGTSNPAEITLNSNTFIFDNSNQISEEYYIPNSETTGSCAVHIIEITSFINPNNQTYDVTIPIQPNENFGDMFNLNSASSIPDVF